MSEGFRDAGVFPACRTRPGEASGVLFDCPLGFVFQPVMPTAQCPEIIFRGGAFGISHRMVEVAASGWLLAPGKPTCAVASLNVVA